MLDAGRRRTVFVLYLRLLLPRPGLARHSLTHHERVLYNSHSWCRIFSDQRMVFCRSSTALARRSSTLRVLQAGRTTTRSYRLISILLTSMDGTKERDAAKSQRGAKKSQKGAGRTPSNKLKGMPKDSLEVRLSKTVSWILRHGAMQEGLELRSDGYARVQDLVCTQSLPSVIYS